MSGINTYKRRLCFGLLAIPVGCTIFLDWTMIVNSPTSYYVLPSVIALGLGLSDIVEAIARPAVNARSQTSYTPVAFAIGTAPVIDSLQPLSENAVTLSPSAPVLTLDYGANVAGFPYFDVTSLAGPAAQIELKYSEQFEGLNLKTGDGPWYFTSPYLNRAVLADISLGSTPLVL